ncbi:lutropin-choriogonadotropic hormone receptor isoform X2 [Nilaparvata lugens]|uniref:lutropin-choriogonadotropic hormone receptor isoform X2 n=1 Tax=Nilaparvata lugens TaxID=108931 RepID=UPI00193E589D|nr:lutropin-choriogonadotropic hormone receptor isoform X2 [Nilaparvata lugens]
MLAFRLVVMMWLWESGLSDWSNESALPPLSDDVASIDPRRLCHCFNHTEGGTHRELECRCWGPDTLHVPQDLPSRVNRITIQEAGMKILRSSALQLYRSSLLFFLTDLPSLHTIQPGAFNNLSELLTIYIHNAPLLHYLDNQVFQINLPRLKTLRIDGCGLYTVPYLGELTRGAPMHIVNIENNKIQALETGDVQVRTDRLLISYNLIEEIEARAFEMSEIAFLSLKGNRDLRTIHKDAFVNISSLLYLDLSETAISHVPTRGLQSLEVLKIQDTPTLKVFPSIYSFNAIKQAWLTYSYHCCAFRFPAKHDPLQHTKHKEFVGMMERYCSKESSGTSTRMRRSWGALNVGNTSTSPPPPLTNANAQHYDRDAWFHQHDVTVPPAGSRVHRLCGNLSKKYEEVECWPRPDAFNPCEDLMGNWVLRVAVWLVAILALLGNLAVLLVLLSSRFRMTVPKFLMCNLALADLCMGLYLLLIALTDVRSIGDYFNYAIDWQNGVGCKVAGFLTVFASELSVFTLTVITGERWYTITYAIHLNKRLKLCTATKIMALGWMYAAAMAALPLFGVSSYSKTSICLPMKKESMADLSYLTTLLMFNGLAFWSICACYSRMYCSIRQGQDAVATLARSDMRVAKRMALLVFTDFACWAPIAFFGLTALAGHPLIDLSKTKILLVFFYPLNSCANPYLYALLTQQYRRDMFILLSRYGLCSKRADRYKGTTGQTPRIQGPQAPQGGPAPLPNHRGSVLTSLTSVESVPVRQGPLCTVPEGSQLEMLPVVNHQHKFDNDQKSNSFL